MMPKHECECYINAFQLEYAITSKQHTTTMTTTTTTQDVCVTKVADPLRLLKTFLAVQ